jgi:hypothetical protein
MGNNQHEFLYYCMWRQKALAVLVLLLVFWWRNQNDNRTRAKRVKYAPLMQRDIWRSSELIRLVDTSDGICMRELRIARGGASGYVFEDCWAMSHTLLCSHCTVEIWMDS